MTSCARRLVCSDRGQALPLVLGMILLISVTVAVAVVLGGAASRDAKREDSRDAALAAAEAGVANGLAMLGNATRPLDPATLPSSGSPKVDAVGDGSVSWYGTVSGDTWTITATSSVPNPAGGGALSRTVSVDARVGSTSVNPAWNYLFADAPGCLTLGDSVSLAEPLYTRGDLCLSSSARFTGSPLQVEGTIETQDLASVGVSGTPIGELKVAGGCRFGSSGSFVAPCASAEHVFAMAQTAVPDAIKKPPLDLAFWYANARPGPTHGCSSGSFPGGFDTDTTMNGSRPDVDLFGDTNYDCVVMSGSSQVGRIAWTNGNPGAFVVDGTVFFDGSIDMSSAKNVSYSGRGTIYSSGHVALGGSLHLCGAWSAGCDLAGWQPSTSMLILVAGSGNASVTQDAAFQGGIYAAGNYVQDNSAQVQGPRIADALTLSSTSAADWPPFIFLPPGAPMEAPVVVTPGWSG